MVFQRDICDISPARRFHARSTRVCVPIQRAYTQRYPYTLCASYRSPFSLSPGPFIGESATEWASRKGECWRGVGAPSYFTVITVTCYRARSLRRAINRRLPLAWVARKEGTGVGGAYRGLSWRRTPLVQPLGQTCATRCVLVTVVTSFSSLSPVLTWDRGIESRFCEGLAAMFDSRENKTMGLAFVRFDATLLLYISFTCVK